MSRSVSHFLESPLVEFHFAGFKGTAHGLQSAGWQISAYEQMSPRSYGREIQLMLHNGGLTMISVLELLDMGQMVSALRDHRPVLMDIMGVSIDGRSTILPMRMEPANFGFLDSKDGFQPIDCSPSIRRVDLGQIDFYRYGVFKRLNVGAEIYLPEKTVDELLNEILKKQEPRQKEIRKNQKRREFMSEFHSDKATDIKAQLIAV